MRIIYKSISLILIICHFSSTLTSQSIEDQINQYITGYWDGAFISENAQERIDIQFYQQDSQLLTLQIIEDWHPQFGEFVLEYQIDSMGRVITNTGLGKATMQIDTNYLEMVGTVENKDRPISLHLKKVPAPPPPTYQVDEFQMKNGDVTLFGHFHRPKVNDSKTAMIIVGGRSCYAGTTKYDLYAKVLREYGISVLVFNKRGTGNSTGDCNTATIQDLASDVAACKRFLEAHPNQYENIGVLGSSAGGWVMVKAEEMVDFDFMISVVGPATSVREQQEQSVTAGAEFYRYSEEMKRSILDYTDLVFDAEATEENFVEFKRRLEKAEELGWKNEMLDGSDIPDNAEEISHLWVRRHGYDPGPVLATFNNPFLAIYGEIDWIVPYQQNIERLNKLFSGERQNLLKAVIAYQAEHGTEVADAIATLPNGETYFHFFRISPQVLIEVVKFLRVHDFIKS